MKRALLLSFVVLTSADCRRVGARTTGGDASSSVPLADGGALTKAAVLESIGRCALESYGELAQLTGALEASVSESDPKPAREAWTRVIDLWQKLEVFQLGPAAPSASPGGRDLREHIYSWPLDGRCLVEQGIVGKSYEKPSFGDGLIATRGLLAAEYVLFYEGTDNACAPQSSINASGAWAALGSELPLRKMRYARAVAADVRARALELEGAWSPTKGNFLEELRSAGKGSKAFATDQLAFQAVSDAMFYVEHTVKDTKLAKPVGLRECATGTCPDAFESRFARRSKQHVKNNLLGFQQLFFGCAAHPLSLDDLMSALGHAAVAQGMQADVNAAIAVADGIPEDDLAAALARDPGALRALYDAVKRVTDRLKMEIAPILDLELPMRVEGDND